MNTTSLFTDVSPKSDTNSDTIAPVIATEDTKLAETFQRVAKQEAHIKSERAKIEQARKEFEVEKEKATKYSSLAGKSPFEILEHFGITYDKLLQADKERANPIDPHVKRALQEVEALKNQVSAKEQEAIQERRSRAELQVKSEIAKTIKEHDFDVIEKLGAEDAVMEYMEEMYSQTQEIPDYKEACQAIVDSIVDKYSKLKDSKWMKPQEPVKVEPIPQADPKLGLSNKMTQSATLNDKPLTEAQRFQAALNALKAG